MPFSANPNTTAVRWNNNVVLGDRLSFSRRGGDKLG